MIFTQAEVEQIQKFKVDEAVLGLWSNGSSYVANINFDTKQIENSFGYVGSCKDYLKMAAMAAHTNRDWYGGNKPPEPYHFKYAAWLRAGAGYDISVMNALEAKWKITPTQLIVVSNKNVDGRPVSFSLFVGDPIWMKSVELLSVFIMLCRNSIKQTSSYTQYENSDISQFMKFLYPRLDDLNELAQFGIVNLNWNEHGPTKNQIIDKESFNAIVHSYVGPYAICVNLNDKLVNGLEKFKPHQSYYDYFKSKSIEPVKTLEKMVL